MYLQSYQAVADLKKWAVANSYCATFSSRGTTRREFKFSLEMATRGAVMRRYRTSASRRTNAESEGSDLLEKITKARKLILERGRLILYL